MDFYTIFLRNIHVDVSIGIHDFERKKPQPLLVSLALFLKESGDIDDNINNVADYDFARALVLKIARSQHWDLQESLCSAIATQCLEPSQVLGVIVQTGKPAVYPDTDIVGCRMARITPAMPDDFQWWSVHV